MGSRPTQNEEGETKIRFVGFSADEFKITSADEFQDAYLPSYGDKEKKLHTLQRFNNQEVAEKIYRTLAMIQNGNIARPAHLLEESEPYPGRTFYLSFEKKGQPLADYVRDLFHDRKLKQKFFLLDDKNNDYALSDFFLTFLRGVINAITVLQQSEIRASVKFSDIYIDKDDCSSWVPVKYYLRRQGETVSDWKSFHEMLSIFNYRLHSWGRPHMKSFTETLQRSKGWNPEKILSHPIFWSWRRRKDLIIHLGDILTCGKYRRFNSDINEGFKDWETIIKKDTNLNTIYDHNTAHGRKMRGDYEKEDLEAANKALLTNNKGNQNAGAYKCVKFMRNAYCHFVNIRTSLNPVLTIKNTEELENVFYQNFPALIYILAPEVAAMDKELDEDFNKSQWDKDFNRSQRRRVVFIPNYRSGV